MSDERYKREKAALIKSLGLPEKACWGEALQSVAALQQEVARLREVLEEMPHTLTCSYRERVCSQPGCDEIHVTPCNCGSDAALSTTSAQAEGIKARRQAEVWQQVATCAKSDRDIQHLIEFAEARAAQLTAPAVSKEKP